MSVSEQQRLFNPYPIKEFVPDIWHGLSKADKRNSTVALTYAYLLDGGLITKAPPKKRKGSRPEIFTKDTRAVKVHEYWSRKFYAGDDFTAKGPRFNWTRCEPALLSRKNCCAWATPLNWSPRFCLSLRESRTRLRND
jgi:hypothetical protein